MKKLAVVLAMFAPMGVMANPYVQANIGVSSISLDTSTDTYEEDGEVSYGVSFGTTVGKNGRIALDYTQFADIKDQTTVRSGLTTTQAEVKLKAKSVGVSAIYDFKNGSPVTPYVGARLGITQLDLEGNASRDTWLSTTNYQVRDKDTHASVGVVTGVQFQVAPSVALDLAAEYNYLGKLEMLDDADVHQFGVKAGVRADF